MKPNVLCLAVLLVAAACSSGGSDPLPTTIQLESQPLTSTVVQVNWTDTSGVAVAEYRVFQSGNLVGTTLANDTDLLVTDLVPGSEHCFDVRAYSASGNATHQSNSDCAETFADQFPAVPTSLTASAVSPGQIDLAWSPVTDDFGDVRYWVLRNGELISFATDPTFQDVGLAPNTSYTYRIVTQDFAGQVSLPTEPTSATTPADLLPPSVSTGLTAAMRTAPDGSRFVSLEWDASVDDGFIVGYRVVRGGAAMGMVVGTSFEDTTFFNNVQHCYQVFPVDAAGNEPVASAEACLHTAWELDTVAASGDLGRNASIAATNETRLDVIHGDGAALGHGSGVLVHSQRTASGWVSGLVDLGELVESSFDVHRAPDGALHVVAMRRGSTVGLLHAVFENGAWSQSTIDATNGAGIHPRLDVGPAGEVHTTYLTTLASVNYALEFATTWFTTALSAPDATVVAPSIAVTPDGVAHVFAPLMDPPLLVHAWNEGTTVRHEFLAAGIDPLVAPAAACAPNGSLHVVYRNRFGRIQHGVWDGTSWSLESVSPVTSNATLPDLAIAPDGRPHVVYMEVGHTALVHAERQGNFWRTSIVDDEASVTDRASIDVGIDGSISMAYRAGSDLHVARRPAP